MDRAEVSPAEPTKVGTVVVLDDLLVVNQAVTACSAASEALYTVRRAGNDALLLHSVGRPPRLLLENLERPPQHIVFRERSLERKVPEVDAVLGLVLLLGLALHSAPGKEDCSSLSQQQCAAWVTALSE